VSMGLASYAATQDHYGNELKSSKRLSADEILNASSAVAVKCLK